jgi:thiosulfate dehydrogenase [quinone] large subunit
MWLATCPWRDLIPQVARPASTDPIVDDHVIEAVVLVVLAHTYTGTTWGLGRMWARTPFVTRHRWAL